MCFDGPRNDRRGLDFVCRQRFECSQDSAKECKDETPSREVVISIGSKTNAKDDKKHRRKLVSVETCVD